MTVAPLVEILYLLPPSRDMTKLVLQLCKSSKRQQHNQLGVVTLLAKSLVLMHLLLAQLLFSAEEPLLYPSVCIHMEKLRANVKVLEFQSLLIKATAVTHPVTMAPLVLICFC